MVSATTKRRFLVACDEDFETRSVLCADDELITVSHDIPRMSIIHFEVEALDQRRDDGIHFCPSETDMK